MGTTERRIACLESVTFFSRQLQMLPLIAGVRHLRRAFIFQVKLSRYI